MTTTITPVITCNIILKRITILTMTIPPVITCNIIIALMTMTTMLGSTISNFVLDHFCLPIYRWPLPSWQKWSSGTSCIPNSSAHQVYNLRSLTRYIVCYLMYIVHCSFNSPGILWPDRSWGWLCRSVQLPSMTIIRPIMCLFHFHSDGILSMYLLHTRFLYLRMIADADADTDADWWMLLMLSPTNPAGQRSLPHFGRQTLCPPLRQIMIIATK